MLASVLHGAGDLRTETVPTPVPADDEVLVRIAAVGVCGSDVHYFRHGRIGSFVLEKPMILGHEAAGTVVAAGRGVDAARIGQRVSIEPQRACRTCEQCKAGHYNLCPAMEFYATPPIDGAFAEYATIQSDYAYAIPDSLSLEAAALCEPLSVGIWANQKAGTAAGSSVLIAGAGPIGVVAAQVAKAFGATRVVVSDPVAERREMIMRFGATETIDPAETDIASLGLEVDAFVDASGAEPAIRHGIHAVRRAGRVVLVGMGADDVSLPVAHIQNRELELTGTFRYANTWPTAIRLLSSGQVDVDSLVTDRFALVDAERALEAATMPETLKAIVTPA